LSQMRPFCRWRFCAKAPGLNDPRLKPRCQYLTMEVEKEMDSSSDTEIRGRLLTLVTGILRESSISVDVLPNSRLFDTGLTSMDMVKLMLGIEAEFDLTIPQTDITPKNFETVHKIEQMILKQTNVK
jgi:acyl carrier protein